MGSWGGGSVSGNEPELREGKCVVPFNYDLLKAIDGSEDPVQALTIRVTEELTTTYGYSPEELDPVLEDPVFHESVQQEYYRIQRGAKHGKLPRTLKVRFGQPATRDAKGNPSRDGPDDGGRLDDE